jgi:hypothetical protein
VASRSYLAARGANRWRASSLTIDSQKKIREPESGR